MEIGRSINGRFAKGFHHTIKTRQKMSKSRTGKGNSMWGKHHSEKTINKVSKKAKERFKNPQNHPRWRGGRRQHIIGGYIEIYAPNHPFKTKEGYIKEHRLVMEKHIGRYLTPIEVVHHINEIKDDNRIENLKLFKTDGIHHSFHSMGHPISQATRRKMSNSKMGHSVSKKTREKISNTKKVNHQKRSCFSI